jgi:hypothetical protein
MRDPHAGALGVGAAEVAAMTLDGIDWRTAEIVVAGAVERSPARTTKGDGRIAI